MNLETLGTARRGYFVEGLGGAQFALSAAVERLRGMRSDEPAGALVLAATDPANPYGATLPWPKRDDDTGSRRPARVPGAYVVTLDAEPALYVERGGKGLISLRDPLGPDGEPAAWLAEALGGARGRGPPRPHQANRSRALRRRVDPRLGVRGGADRGGLPPDAAQAHAQRLIVHMCQVP